MNWQISKIFNNNIIITIIINYNSYININNYNNNNN